QGVDATFTTKESADDFRRDLKAAYEAGQPTFYQCSILALSKQKRITFADGQPGWEVVEFTQPFNIDIVNEGGAAGLLKYAVQSARGETANHKGAIAMDPRVLKVLFKQNPTRLALVRQAAVTAKAEGVTDQSTEDQVAEAIASNAALVTQAAGIMETPTAEETAAEAARVAAEATRVATAAQAARAAESDEIPMSRLPQALRTSLVNQAFRDSQLPDAVQEGLRKK